MKNLDQLLNRQRNYKWSIWVGC